jgi:hypothetical protein
MEIKKPSDKLWAAAEVLLGLFCLSASMQRDFSGFLVVVICICCVLVAMGVHRWWFGPSL